MESENIGFGVMRLENGSFKLPKNMRDIHREKIANVEDFLYCGFRNEEFPYIVLSYSPRLTQYSPHISIYDPERLLKLREIPQSGVVSLPDYILNLISNPEKVFFIEYEDHVRIWNLQTFASKSKSKLEARTEVA